MKKLNNLKSVFRKNLSHIVGGILVITCALVLVLYPAITKAETYGGTGDGGYSTGKCKTGNCYSLYNGAFWIKVPASSDDIDPRSLGFGTVFSGEHITGCQSGGGYAYILVTRLSGGGLAGMVNIDEAMKRGGVNDGDGGSVVGGGEIVSEAAAHGKFNDHWADFYSQPPYNQNYTGTNLSWFCADPTTSTTKTTTSTTTTYSETCVPGLVREMQETWTRIAVQNVTLDGWGGRRDTPWRATGPRSPLHTDSWWAGGGDDDVKTIAKPGDSVQFLHEFCAADRYVRRTPDQNVHWTGAESHTEIFDIPTNHFQIYGIPNDTYAFGDGIEWVNSVAASVSAYENLFTRSGIPDTWVDDTRYSLGTLSPTRNNNNYNCSSVGQYPFYRRNATYQVPGYDTGWGGPCSAATSTDGNTNQVGQTFGQKHVYNMVKAWEQWTHNRSGSCGCNVHDAVHLGNFFSPEYGKIGSEWGERNKWECGSVCTKCCHWTCDNCCDKYGHCISGSNKWDSWPYIPEDFEFRYHSESKDYGDTSKTALVYTPFNFTTTTTSNLNAGDVIFQGGAIGSSFNWSVEARANDKTSPSFSYATVTPSWTRIRMVEFLYQPDAAPGSKKVEGMPDWEDDSHDLNDEKTGPCHYYEQFGAKQCREIDSIKGNQNPEGLYIGTKDGRSYTQTVPDNDEYVGFKYCVAVGFFPSDSHDYKANSLERQYKYGRWRYNGSAMDAGDYWNISGASCRTIAKKPNVQVWNGTTYTDNKINTSITKKMVGKGLGTAYKDNNTTLFGSWTDYSIIADGSVRGMASGAMLGYTPEKYNFSGGGQPRNGTNFKKLSPITIANNQNGESGKSNVDASASINVNLNRLRARYADKAESFAGGVSSTKIKTSNTGMQYAYYNGNVNLSAFSIQRYSNTKEHPNQTTEYDGNGFVKYLGDGDNDNTLVFKINGKLTINGNISLGNTNTPEKLENFAAGTSTNSAAKLPQVIIFADNIDIAEDVTRIDAWLIVPNGTINTCAGYKIEDTLAAGDAKHRWGNQYGNCYKTLVVSGPVYASELKLLRTAGGTHGSGQANTGNVLTKQYAATGEDASDANLGAVAPAEVFNLRADAYLWAYNQAQRYSEAVVTYTRELAPRY